MGGPLLLPRRLSIPPGLTDGHYLGKGLSLRRILAEIVLHRLVDKIEEKFLMFIEEGRTVLSADEVQISRRKCLCFSEAIVPLDDLLNIRPNRGVRAVKADDPPR
jgi:hypothetical protein